MLYKHIECMIGSQPLYVYTFIHIYIYIHSLCKLLSLKGSSVTNHNKCSYVNTMAYLILYAQVPDGT